MSGRGSDRQKRRTWHDADKLPSLIIQSKQIIHTRIGNANWRPGFGFRFDQRIENKCPLNQPTVIIIAHNRNNNIDSITLQHNWIFSSFWFNICFIQLDLSTVRGTHKKPTAMSRHKASNPNRQKGELNLYTSILSSIALSQTHISPLCWYISCKN